MLMSELQEIYKHPMVQELIQQNQMMAEQLPDDAFQNLSLSKKINLENIKVPHTIKNRLLFQEGLHNGLFYPGNQLKENLSLWDNNDIMYAEHTDASNSWVGLTKNPHYVENEKAIYGDLELVDKSVAQKLEYQILNKDGHMGLSPTIDVDKQMVQGRLCAMGPYKLKSQSIVLDPAVRTTMFNSNSALGGAATMEPTQEQLAKKEELEKKNKEELERVKGIEKELANYKEKELASEVEELAKLELAIGRTTEEHLAARTEILMKLSKEERAVLKESYGWVSRELSTESEDDRFVNSLSEEMKGKIPPSLMKFIEERKMKKQEADNANLTPEEIKKKADEEMAHMTPAERKKKEEEERSLANKGNSPPEQKLNTENLSRAEEKLIGRNDLNRFQELSAENKESNQGFLDLLNRNQGTYRGGGK